MHFEWTILLSRQIDSLREQLEKQLASFWLQASMHFNVASSQFSLHERLSSWSLDFMNHNLWLINFELALFGLSKMGGKRKWRLLKPPSSLQLTDNLSLSSVLIHDNRPVQTERFLKTTFWTYLISRLISN